MVKLKLAAAAMFAVAAVMAPSAAFPQATAITEIVPADGLKDVPRNQTLILGWSINRPRVYMFTDEHVAGV